MDTSNRNPRLKKLFYDITDGRNDITHANASHFLQAICAWEDVVACVDKITASKAGIATLQQAVRAKLVPSFLDGEVANLCRFLSAPELKNVNGGAYLRDIVIKLVDPPIFWNAFRDAYLRHELKPSTQFAVGWLFYQMCCLPIEISAPHHNHQDTPAILKSLLGSDLLESRQIGQKLKHVLEAHASVSVNDGNLAAGPGGRHDNDYPDFRKIAILPTADEISCVEPAFLRPAEVLEDPETADSRVAIHLDNQFRLLREDMIYEMREELLVVLEKKYGRSRRSIQIANLKVKELEFGPGSKRAKWGLVLECTNDLPTLKNIGRDYKKRRDYLENHRYYLKHQSLSCLLSGKQIIAFPTIARDEDRLAKVPPEIVLQFDGLEATKKALQTLRMDPSSVYLVQIDTPLFAYEPILKQLQTMNTLPLAQELLLWTSGQFIELERTLQASKVVELLRDNPEADLEHVLKLPKSTRLDQSQADSLLCGLTQKVSLIQGPPGTGKSFIGALLAKAIYEHTGRTILVVCFTNHALDDILEGLLKIGLPKSVMLRLGGKSTDATEPLTLQKQQFAGNRRTHDQWTIINQLKTESENHIHELLPKFDKYRNNFTHYNDIMEYLEFNEPRFFEAFSVPQSEDGMTRVGSGGQGIKRTYLIDRWLQGKDAGSLQLWLNEDEGAEVVWSMSHLQRQKKRSQWEEAIIVDLVEDISSSSHSYNHIQGKLTSTQSANILQLLKSKRIVGCTTTAAAKYCTGIQAFNPDVLLVEEAGEILESHILTSLGPEASQMILIGDHKQLRPKVNNYALTIEKGEGYDLNRSLFERLIMKEYPHNILQKQHRMRPEISSLIRLLTYPELVDAPTTLNRPNVLGLQDNIVFINHEHLEDDLPELAEKRDMAATSSKRNSFEAEMILKTIKYLGQQGYGTEELVVLTPYLGQLQNLREALKADNDPILSDLDSYELIKAGLINSADAKLTKKSLRLATIDNYQGEECDIVIISLTRSNAKRDIGFLFAPERLNVLLSRSRNGLIIIGNMDTFINARNPKGKELWTRLFSELRVKRHLYDGLPVKCEKHPDMTCIISQPEQFELACPDGGCNAPCGVLLSCGVHPCPSKCHPLVDHTKMPCKVKTRSTCPNGHPTSFRCDDGPPKSCRPCDRAAKLAKEKQDREEATKRRREEAHQAHLDRMHALNLQLDEIRKQREEERLASERAGEIRQREEDLAMLYDINTVPSTISAAEEPSGPMSPSPSALPEEAAKSNLAECNIMSSPAPELAASRLDGCDPTPENQNLQNIADSSKPKPFSPLVPSPSNETWSRKKLVEGASNEDVDAIMALIGLEEVKQQVLNTIVKIEATTRQNASLARERFNIVFLGNPGTGKTTVARHYAGFLASMGVTPGSHFSETTGSSLANKGVTGATQLVEDTVKAGGGTIFIDETYQLTNGDNYGGKAVLDYLLAEMENRVGTLVFILAGYNKEMETFFEHNPGLQSRVPHRIRFADYKDEELMAIFKSVINRTFQGRMKVEGGIDGLYGRIAIRRLARRRGSSGFGNARDVQTMFDRIRARQAARLNKIRQAGGRADDLLFTAQDLIGADPSEAVRESAAWNSLQGLIGLGAVKKAVKSMFNTVLENYRRELMEVKPVAFTLHRVFLGPPGTGKTTVAKLYGQILVDLGMLSNGEVVVKNPADFVGGALGQSEANTKAILCNTVGKVLVIDEAYMLYQGGGDSGGSSNQFKESVVDTMVAEIQSEPGEDRCVLMLGYTEQMLDMFQHVNPGLKRRFSIEDAFKFEDFNDAELSAVLDLKLATQDLGATPEAKIVALSMLSRRRNQTNFGNAGEVENVITTAKQRCMARREEQPVEERSPAIVFEPQDFDPDYDRAARAGINLDALFADVVGHTDLVEQLRGYQKVVEGCKQLGLDPRDQIPMNFVFSGPPGTGKTTIARKIGQVFYDLGLLGSSEFSECSTADLEGQYVGQTGPKVKNEFEKALGKVLFIDEAYRLCNGPYGKEAIDEIVTLVTQPRFKGKLVIILAGYEEEMNNLLAVNSGLASRFGDRVVFENLDAADCIAVVRGALERSSMLLEGIEDTASRVYREMTELVRDLQECEGWGNARDMLNAAKRMVNCALKRSSKVVKDEEALEVLYAMLEERRRAAPTRTSRRGMADAMPMATQNASAPPPPAVAVDTIVAAPDMAPERVRSPPPRRAESPASSRSATPSERGRGRGRGRGGLRGDPGARGRGRGRGGPQMPVQMQTGVAAPDMGAARGRGRGRGGPQMQMQVQVHSHGPPRGRGRGGGAGVPHVPPQDPVMRDRGVSDAVWARLNEAKRAAAEQDRQAAEAIAALEREAQRKAETEASEEEAVRRLASEALDAAGATERDGLLREREAARLRAHAARVEKERKVAEAAARKEEERVRREQEARAQRKLRELGVCPVGFRWIRMGDVYRCAGGAHVVSVASLEL